MGFASGKLWATANVGASAPEKYGKYYAWGETETKSTYTWNNYEFYDTGSEWNKIESEDIGGEFAFGAGGHSSYSGGAVSSVWAACLDPAYSDARFSQNGNTYYSRMPSKADFQELLNNTTRAEATVNGVKGVMFTSKKNGNKIFLPYAGSYYDAKKPSNGTVSYYWTSSDYTDDAKRAWALKVPSADVTLIQVQCRTGLPIRPIAYIDEDDTPPTEPYAVLSSDKKTLTFYYDDQKDNRSGTKYELNTGNNNPGWKTYDTNITTVVFNSSFQNARPTSCYSWFANMQNLKTITGISYLNTSEVTNMHGMFFWTNSLKTLNLSNFNTSKVTDMSLMFADCSNLTSLSQNFDTSNVTDMTYMFWGCSSLTSLTLKWNTSKVTSMTGMFLDCYNLSDIDVSWFDTRNTTSMYRMFDGCQKLGSLNLMSFTFKSTTETSLFAYGCGSQASGLSVYLPVTAKFLNETAFGYTSLDVYIPIGFDESWLSDPFKGGEIQGIWDNLFFELEHFVDLGLPSKTLWAKDNIGASSFDALDGEYLYTHLPGLYNAWSDKGIKEKYTWDNYSKNISSLKDYNPGYWYSEFDSYNSDYYAAESIPMDWDLLYVDHIDYYPYTKYATYNVYNVGIPTSTEFKELANNCTMKEETIKNRKGIRFTSKKNGNSIFLSYGGCYYDNSTPTDGTASYYWTSTSVDSQKAYAASLANGKLTVTSCQKRTGMPLRAVGRFKATRECRVEGIYDSNSGNFAVDGINNIKSQIPNDGAIYTLQGVKVEGKPQPGIYVSNGRKFVVK